MIAPTPFAIDGADVVSVILRPQCPQPHVDVGHLLRVPPHIEIARAEEDEFRCLNLNVSRPAKEMVPGEALLPVLVWIHGALFLLLSPTVPYKH